MTAAQLLASAAPLTREEARAAARRELSKPPYHRDDPSLLDRALEAVGRWVTDLFERAAAVGPGGRIGAVLLVVLLILLLVAVRLRIGPLARRAPATVPLLGERPCTPDQYRASAAAAAAAGNFAAALRDRLRALARDVEVRGVLEPRAGRTADELVSELTAISPEVDSRLPASIAAFDAVWYGGRTAQRADYDLAVAADEALIDALRRPRTDLARGGGVPGGSSAADRVSAGSIEAERVPTGTGGDR